MSSQANMSYFTTTDSTSDEDTTELPAGSDNVGFIFVPLAVLITVMFLSAMVYLMARNRRRISNFYKRVHVPAFSFDPSDLEDNEDPTECLLRGKLQIDNLRQPVPDIGLLRQAGTLHVTDEPSHSNESLPLRITTPKT